MKLKHLYTKLRSKLKPRGVTITGPRLSKTTGQWVADVKIAKWYIPLLMLKGLSQTTIPRRYWLLLYWRYYVEQRWKGAD